MKNPLNDIEAAAQSSSNIREITFAVADLQHYMDEEQNAGRTDISEDDANRLKDVGKVLFNKVLEHGGQNVFANDISMKTLRNLVSQVDRVGQVRPMIDELGLDSMDDNPTALLFPYVKVGKSSVGNFFDMIEGAKFTDEDEGFQEVLRAYSHMLEVTVEEGATDPRHRPTKGIETFGDLFSGEVKDRIARAGQKHAAHTEMRALAASCAQFDVESSIDSAEFEQHSSYMEPNNAPYYAQIALAGSVIASRDFVTLVDSPKGQAEMMEHYLHAADVSLHILRENGNLDESFVAIYPDVDHPRDVFRDDLQVFLDMLPQEVLDNNINAPILQRLHQFTQNSGAQVSAGMHHG